MLMSRDRRVLRFIDDFGCATTRQLKSIFFADTTLRRCQQRLKMLCSQKHLNRSRDVLGVDYLYYGNKRPREVAHMLARVDYYIKVNDGNLTAFDPEYKLGNLRADAYYEVLGTPFFLEIQLSRHFNQNKYELAYQSGLWDGEFPTVVVVSPHDIKFRESEINFKLFLFSY